MFRTLFATAITSALITLQLTMSLASATPAQIQTASPAQAADAADLYRKCESEMSLRQDNRALSTCEGALAADPSQASTKMLSDTCVLLYDKLEVDQAVPTCDLAIAADPKRAELYFIKGSILFSDSTITNGKYVVPPAGIAALKKYLALAPNGEHASYVKAMLATTQ
jgi:tetratricopeptide (TPR) repeat protein